MPLPAYIFVLCPPFCGSTILWKLVGSSPMVSSLPMEGQFLPEVREAMRLTPWNEKRQMPWLAIKTAWHKHWDSGKPFLLEKSPPNLLRADEIAEHFDPAYFLIMVRDPYAHCESLIRRNGLDAQAAAKFSMRLLARQARNAAELPRSMAFTYEQMTAAAAEVCAKIQAFIPGLGALQPESASPEGRPLINMNGSKISRLDPAELDAIGEVLESHHQTLSYWGYSRLERGLVLSARTAVS